MNIYLNIKEKTFNDLKADAKIQAKEAYGDVDLKDNLTFDNIDLEYDVKDTPSYDEKENTLEIFGDLKTADGKTLGDISMGIPLDFELVISIIEAYRKRLAKVKSVLESTKED